MKFAYVGSRTTRERNARGDGISIFLIDEYTSDWKLVETVKNEENPSFLCFDNNKEHLYAVHGDLYSVSSYKINQKNGGLTYLNTVKAGGKNPVFLTVDATNRYLFVASLQGGSVATLLIKLDGSLTEPYFCERLEGTTEEGVSHAHQCLLDREKKFLFVPTQGRKIGYGGIFVYKINEDGGLIRTQRFLVKEYEEPRHMVMDYTNSFGYILNEHGNSITVIEFNNKFGTFTPIQNISTLPDIYMGESQAGEIVIHPNNRFIYSSNRTHDSIALFHRNLETGYLKLISCTSCLGKIPRFIELGIDGKQLFVANEESDTINIFSVDEETGELRFSERTIYVGSPVCIIFK